MATPELRQFGDLEAEDFERYPVWVGCHTTDHGKPWHGQTDEETFRPWIGKLPVDPAEGIFLVRAVIELRDGSRYPGFVTPTMSAENDARENGAQLLGTQQPHMFVADHAFSFWGSMIGVSARRQRNLYAALGKRPGAIFPLRFSADLRLSSGVTTGEVKGFYRSTREGIQTIVAEPLDEQERDEFATTARLCLMSAKSWQGYAMPGGLAEPHAYKTVVYSSVCPRCGIYDDQKAPFRFAKSGRKELSGFMQFNWVTDMFFVSSDIAREIQKTGITGVSFGSAIDHRSGIELVDRVQMLITTIIPCAETSRLPTVTCRPENEEVLAVRAIFDKQPRLPGRRGESVLSPELKETFRKDRERMAALPYCGRVKYHVPTSLALMPANLTETPDLFQTSEWFGSGAAAFRLTIASERFVNLFKEQRWKGLVFERLAQNGWSERAI